MILEQNETKMWPKILKLSTKIKSSTHLMRIRAIKSRKISKVSRMNPREIIKSMIPTPNSLKKDKTRLVLNKKVEIFCLLAEKWAGILLKSPKI